MQISDTQVIAVSIALVPFLISLATFLYKSYLSRLPQSKQALLMTVTHTAVQAAEQMGSGAAGPVKKKIAEDAVASALKSLGVRIDPAFVNAAIESLVFAMNQENSQQERPLDTSRISG